MAGWSRLARLKPMSQKRDMGHPISRRSLGLGHPPARYLLATTVHITKPTPIATIVQPMIFFVLDRGVWGRWWIFAISSAVALRGVSFLAIRQSGRVATASSSNSHPPSEARIPRRLTAETQVAPAARIAQKTPQLNASQGHMPEIVCPADSMAEWRKDFHRT